MAPDLLYQPPSLLGPRIKEQSEEKARVRTGCLGLGAELRVRDVRMETSQAWGGERIADSPCPAAGAAILGGG